MRRFLARLFGTDSDPLAFCDVLQASHQGIRYTKADRYGDFRAVFMGQSTPEQGQRVLAEIFRKGGMWAPSMASDNPYEIAARAGANDLCKWIMATMNADPEREQPNEEAASYDPLRH